MPIDTINTKYKTYLFVNTFFINFGELLTIFLPFIYYNGRKITHQLTSILTTFYTIKTRYNFLHPAYNLHLSYFVLYILHNSHFYLYNILNFFFLPDLSFAPSLNPLQIHIITNLMAHTLQFARFNATNVFTVIFFENNSLLFALLYIKLKHCSFVFGYIPIC